jgi:hypothetical protein
MDSARSAGDSHHPEDPCHLGGASHSDGLIMRLVRAACQGSAGKFLLWQHESFCNHFQMVLPMFRGYFLIFQFGNPVAFLITVG